MPYCIECNASLDIPDDVEIGEIIECDNCGVELEVISTKPVKLKIFEEEEK
ncbi:MAG: lysine biosynthesis protein LysW [Candidatus Firestonebacteria bacterium]|nr:lysine biosynthesis protein LysW [Candidatus Firestonebacteria bacterium]